jgi:hypothetical protein
MTYAMTASQQLTRRAATILYTIAALLTIATGFHLEPRQSPSTTLPLWVSVDASSVAHTITPTISAGSTISGAPESLTSPTPFVLTKGTLSSTTTLPPPVATANTTRGAPVGSFLACENQNDAFAPLCQPEDGVVLGVRNSFFGEAPHLPASTSS